MHTWAPTTIQTGNTRRNGVLILCAEAQQDVLCCKYNIAVPQKQNAISKEMANIPVVSAFLTRMYSSNTAALESEHAVSTC